MSEMMPVPNGQPAATGVAPWTPPVEAEPGLAPSRSPLERPLAALRRYKYLIVGVMILGAAGGAVATRFVTPLYDAWATIWIESAGPMQQDNGPIRSRGLLNAAAWVELLRSYRIVDAVVSELGLYLKPKTPADSGLFAGFKMAPSYVTGNYSLTIDGKRQRWELARKGAPTDSGTRLDSIGYKLGFRWRLPDSAFAHQGHRKAEFTVRTPREASMDLLNILNAAPPKENSNFMWLNLQGEDPNLTARTLNTWLREYVSVATELKNRNLVEFSKILSTQLSFAEQNMRSAEQSLESFRVHTITLPQEGGPIAPGVEATRDPALKSFFEQKIEYDNLRNDREALEKIIATETGSIPFEGVLLIPSVAESPGAGALRKTFEELYSQQAKLTAAREVYTDSFPTVRDLIKSVETLKMQTIPAMARQLLAQLKGRETDYQRRISTQSGELQNVPTRTIEEMRLRRAVNVSEALYTTLKARHAEATLAEAGATPDVRILDTAVAFLAPTKNTAPQILLVAVFGSLGAGIGLAILLDLVDRRIRYSEQVNQDLGLVIAGAVPQIPRGGVNAGSPEQVSGLIESFRSVRLHVTSTNQLPAAIAISSASPGDGKSLVAANLALSFADAGFRTVLVDADTRRGKLHQVFGMAMAPGLTDFLSNDVSLSAIIHPTSQDNLSVVASGRRIRRSPELLTSPLLGVLVGQLRQSYEVVILDTPPLAAGIDAYAVASAAANLLMVVRVGRTDRRMAAAKLLVVDRLPIRVLGAVLNGVNLTGEYQYYGYSSGYALTEGEVEPVG